MNKSIVIGEKKLYIKDYIDSHVLQNKVDLIITTAHMLSFKVVYEQWDGIHMMDIDFIGNRHEDDYQIIFSLNYSYQDVFINIDAVIGEDRYEGESDIEEMFDKVYEFLLNYNGNV